MKDLEPENTHLSRNEIPAPENSQSIRQQVDILQSVMSEMDTVVVALDEAMRIDYLSCTCEELNLGWDALGKPLKLTNLTAIDNLLDEDVENAIKSKQPLTRQVSINQTIGFSRQIFPKLVGGQHYNNGILIAYTKAKDASKAHVLERRAAEEKTIGVLLRLGLQDLTLKEHLQQIVPTLIENLPGLHLMPKAGIFLSIETADSKVLQLSASYNMSAEHKVVCSEVPIGSCLCGKALETKEALFGKNNFSQQKFYSQCMEGNGHYCLPLKQGNKVFGVLSLHTLPSHINSIPDQNFLNRITDVVAASVLRRITENQLIEAKQEAERANSAKSEFLSCMSHELRTPLNVILGFGQLLKLESKRENKDSESLELILNAGKHLLELINDILDLAKIDAGMMTISLKNVSVDKLISNCTQLVKPLARESDISIEYIVKPCWVKADAIRLTQVLLNLIMNAVKYNRTNGRVMVKCETKGKSIIISVTDSGYGIKEEQKSRLFEPFQRFEHKKVSGTGIGLNITRKLTELMGGQVGFTSKYGEGSTFWVELPKGEAEIASIAEPDAKYSTPIASAKKEVILYVEDDKDNIVLMQHIMKKIPHYELIVAEEAEEGIKIAQRLSPSLIILDINLPGMSGFDALKLLSTLQETNHIPVFALTADARPEQITAGLSAGFKAYLTKPVNIDTLLDKTNKVIIHNKVHRKNTSRSEMA